MPNPYAPNTSCLNDAGVVVRDLSCRKCGYNLRGLNDNGCCPECGSAVGMSVHGNYLRFSDPAWVRSLRGGIDSITWGTAVLTLGFTISVVLTMIPVESRITSIFVACSSLVALALFLKGGWDLTEPDPSGVGEFEYGWSRRLVRIGLTMGVGAMLVLVCRTFGIEFPMEQIVDLALLGGFCGFCTGHISLLYFLEQLTLRIPAADVALTARSRRHMTMFLYVAFGGLTVASRFVNIAQPGTIFLILITFGASYLWLIISLLRMLEEIGRLISDQASYAELTWKIVQFRMEEARKAQSRRIDSTHSGDT